MALRLERRRLPVSTFAGASVLDISTRAWPLRLVDLDWRPLLIPLSIMGLIGIGALWLMPGRGYDAYAYWAVNPSDPYPGSGDFGAFRYAPPVALLLAPLGLLPFELAYVVWLSLSLLALLYLFGRWALVAVLFPPVFADLAFGNVNVLFAAMIVGAFQRPGLWSFALLTKITPAVGVVWHAARGEWRSLLTIVVVVTVAVCISMAIQGPGVWISWLEMLFVRQDYSSIWVAPVPLAPRLVLSLAIVLWGARTDRRWTVAVALVLAIPTWYWSGLMLAPLIAVVPLWRRHRRSLESHQGREERSPSANRSDVFPRQASSHPDPGSVTRRRP